MISTNSDIAVSFRLAGHHRHSPQRPRQRFPVQSFEAVDHARDIVARARRGEHERAGSGGRDVVVARGSLRMTDSLTITRANPTLQARELITQRGIVE
jgi:hypothetical protein